MCSSCSSFVTAMECEIITCMPLYGQLNSRPIAVFMTKLTPVIFFTS